MGAPSNGDAEQERYFVQSETIRGEPRVQVGLEAGDVEMLQTFLRRERQRLSEAERNWKPGVAEVQATIDRLVRILADAGHAEEQTGG